MSFAALAWAAKQRPGNLAAKMVLLGLANFADEHGCAYPSTAALAEFGDMDHKTATAALDRLAGPDLALISDTGARAGRTKQIKVYRLNLESIPKAEGNQKRKASENGSHPVPLPEAPQKRGTDTVREPVPQKAAPSSDAPASKRDPFPCPDGVDPAHWRDFRANRRSKRLKDTPTAYRGLLREIAKFSDEDWPPGRIVQHAAERGWGGIFDPRGREGRHGNGSGNHGGRREIGNPMVRAAADDLARRAARGDLDLGR